MNTEPGGPLKHPIRVVARRTSLSPTLLRAWEKRYGVVTPDRSEGGQRLYSDEDVQKLTLLKAAVEAGRSISQVAQLSVEALEALVAEDRSEGFLPDALEPLGAISAAGILEEAERWVRGMASAQLERTLTRGALALPVPVFSDEVLAPLLARIGDGWRLGKLGAAEEHLASTVIRRVLEWLLNTVAVGEGAPVLVVATPVGERHEFGALLSALSAATEGWQPFFLGPDLPAEEIGAAAQRLNARMVALSVVDPDLAEGHPEEVEKLRSILKPSVNLVVGGPREILEGLGVEGVEPMESFHAFRKRVREENSGG